MTIIYGWENELVSEISQTLPNVSSYYIKPPSDYGSHHTKMMLLFYKDGSMRVVISTANLQRLDWNNLVQGVWISNRLPGLNSENSGESATNFRSDLVHYLSVYNIVSLKPFIDRVKKSDFSSVNVYLITSVPGSHKNNMYGLPRIGSLLSQHSAPVDNKHAIIIQSSSIGNFGKIASAYFTGEVMENFKRSLGDEEDKGMADIKLIYPTLANVQQFYGGIKGAYCLPYKFDVHNRQLWLNKFLYQWKSDLLNRGHAIPHIKSYFRYSETGVFWFLLTSANMSKGAWGVTKNFRASGSALNISNYEVGVAFFPRVILNKDRFPMNEQQCDDKTPIFRLPFDVPPVRYGHNDVPFCADGISRF